MGLDFSHCDARWGYIGFHRFRLKLARAAGYTIVKGDSLMGPMEVWESEDDQPLDPLLYHSDCDGIISPEDCAKVAPALEAAVKDWPEDDYDRVNALRLAEGMRLAAAKGEDLAFA